MSQPAATQTTTVPNNMMMMRIAPHHHDENSSYSVQNEVVPSASVQVTSATNHRDDDDGDDDQPSFFIADSSASNHNANNVNDLATISDDDAPTATNPIALSAQVANRMSQREMEQRLQEQEVLKRQLETRLHQLQTSSNLVKGVPVIPAAAAAATEDAANVTSDETELFVAQSLSKDENEGADEVELDISTPLTIIQDQRREASEMNNRKMFRILVWILLFWFLAGVACLFLPAMFGAYNVTGVLWFPWIMVLLVLLLWILLHRCRRSQ